MMNLWGKARSADGCATPPGPLSSSPPGSEAKCGESLCLSAPPKVRINSWGQIKTRRTTSGANGLRGRALFPDSSADGDSAALPPCKQDEGLSAVCSPPGSQAGSALSGGEKQAQAALLSMLVTLADAQRERHLRLETLQDSVSAAMQEHSECVRRFNAAVHRLEAMDRADKPAAATGRGTQMADCAGKAPASVAVAAASAASCAATDGALVRAPAMPVRPSLRSAACQAPCPVCCTSALTTHIFPRPILWR